MDFPDRAASADFLVRARTATFTWTDPRDSSQKVIKFKPDRTLAERMNEGALLYGPVCGADYQKYMQTENYEGRSSALRTLRTSSSAMMAAMKEECMMTEERMRKAMSDVETLHMHRMDYAGYVETGEEQIVDQDESTRFSFFSITNDKGCLSLAEIGCVVQAAEKCREEDESRKQKIKAKNGLENLRFTVRNTHQEEKHGDKFMGGNKDKIEVQQHLPLFDTSGFDIAVDGRLKFVGLQCARLDAFIFDGRRGRFGGGASPKVGQKAGPREHVP